MKYLITLTLLIIFVFGCGKDNKVKSNSVGTTGGIPQGFQPIQTAGVNVQCRPYTTNYGFQVNVNGQRFELTFSGGGPISNTTVGGQFSPGRVNGTIAKTYFGVVPSTGDLVRVEKMVNGTQVVGYNIILSLCYATTTGSYGQTIALVTPDMQFNRLMGGLTLDDDTNCGFGNVDYADLQLSNNSGYGFPLTATKVCTK